MSLDSLLMRLFGRPQGLLGRLGGVVMAHTKKEFTLRTIGLLQIQPGDRVLEVGFGPGVALRWLAESTPASYIGGVDSSREMLAQATSRNAGSLAEGRMDLRLASADHLPFEDPGFDKAISINSLQVWPDAAAGLREIRRVLKVGGQLALGFTAHSRQPKTGLAEQVLAAGFAEAQLIETEQGFCLLATA
jgi:ubiquinone/menaquinone biosynthesis C-methylase UbiE